MLRFTAICLMTAAIMTGGPAAASAAHAVHAPAFTSRGCVTCLGGPTSTLSPIDAFPLGGFHQIGTRLKQFGRPELLFLGTQLDSEFRDTRSQIERWPVVKALDQFGTISNISAARKHCYTTPGLGPRCSEATFDWSHAVYHSRYVAFVHKDLLNREGQRYQKWSGEEKRLYYQYVRASQGFGPSDEPDRLLGTAAFPFFNGNDDTSRLFPLMLVDGYLQTGNDIVTSGDFEGPIGVTSEGDGISSGLPFSTIQKSLINGKEPNKYSHLIVDVNAEANVITALICHADGRQPARVCGRPAIRQVLKHVK